MKKQLLFLLTTILSFNCYSQIIFEKGYYIDNLNQKTDCLIKNIDWKNNPTEFEYKLSENSEPKKATIKTIKEFGVYAVSKYIKKTVNIDKSSEDINYLSNDRKPIFNEEELFLKVLVEGKSNLYEYTDDELRRYFYSKENSIIEQLVFKTYITKEDNIFKNDTYKQQLWTDLKCPEFTINKIERVEYNKKNLVRFFTEYSKCSNNELINYEPKQKKDLFNLTIRPRFNNSSLRINNPATEFNLKNVTGFGLGLEAEFILPFNKNKWAMVIEPTYQNFKSEETINNLSYVSGGKSTTKADYKSIEIPVSLRHYFFLNNNSKIYLNASYVFDLSSKKSSIEFIRDDNSIYNSLEIETRNNLAFGIGYKLYNKYSIEIRHQTSREILGNYIFWNSEYKTLSIIFGYSFL